MNNLISFELRKLFRTKSFYICLGVSLALVVMNALLTKSEADAGETTVNPDSFVLAFTSNGMLTMMCGIFTSIFVTDDYTCGTIKNIYAKGYSRNEVYFAKYIASAISTLIFAGVSLVSSSAISQSLFNGEKAVNDTLLISLFLQVILLLAYNSLYFVLSMVIGKLGSSIALSIVGPSVVSLLLTLTDSFLKLDNFKLNEYWLDTCLSSVQAVNCSTTAILSSGIISVLVIALSMIIGLKINSKKEF